MSKFKRGWQNSDDHILCDAEVHYLWINHSPDEGERNLPLCTVELERLKRAFENGRKYPEATFTLWVDFKYLDAMSKFWVDSYFDSYAPPNFTLKDLNDIELYKTNPRMGMDKIRRSSPHDVFTRTDLARFYILQERLKKSTKANIVYSDLDANNVLNIPRAGKSLFEKYGFIIGKASNAIVMHAYVAVKKGHPHAKLFVDNVVERTCEYYDQNKHGTNGPIVKAVLSDMLGANMISVMNIKPMPKIGYKVPRDRFLTFHKIR